MAQASTKRETGTLINLWDRLDFQVILLAILPNVRNVLEYPKYDGTVIMYGPRNKILKVSSPTPIHIQENGGRQV